MYVTPQSQTGTVIMFPLAEAEEHADFINSAAAHSLALAGLCYEKSMMNSLCFQQE